MKRTSKKLGVALAVAAASLLATGCTSLCGESAKEAMVKCAGVNTCKGTTSCSTPSDSCKGGHKKKGWTYMTEGECKARGGHVVN